MKPDAVNGALRTAATLVHTAPLLRAVVSLNGRIVTEATHPGSHPETDGCDSGSQYSDGEVNRLAPCEFRKLVIGATQDPIMLAEVAPGVGDISELSVDIEVPHQGAVHADCMYRVSASATDHLWLMATHLPAADAHESGLDIVHGSRWALENVSAFGIRDDCATGVSIAYARTSEEPASPGEKRLLDLLEALLARWTVRELLAAEMGDHNAGRRSF